MDIKELVNYIKDEHSKGVKNEIIADKLIIAGWSKESIKQGFVTVFGHVPSIKLLRLSSIDSLMSETSSFYARYWKQLLMIALIPNLYDFIIWIIELLIVNTFHSTLSVYYLLPTFIIGTIVRIWSTAAFMYYITADSKVTIIQLLDKDKIRLFKFWLTVLLTTIFILSGLILLIIPGIILSIFFSCTPYLFYTENNNGISALKRSYYYVKSYFIQTAERLLAIGISIIALQYSMNFIINASGLGMLKTPIWLLISVVIQPIPYIYGYLLYKQLRELKSIPVIKE